MVFPDPLTHDYGDWVEVGEYLYSSRDVVAWGTPLTAENVREAYLKGIFPWNTPGLPLPWHCPELRAILEFAELRVPRSLRQAKRKGEFNFTIDNAFAAVMRECALAYRPGQPGTWISPEFEQVYGQLHREGMAHSVEAWETNGNLAGGLYGIDAGGVFCGESMFFKQSNASKLALLHLIDHLAANGSTWLDCQVMTPHLEQLGAKEITRMAFLEKLRRTQESRLDLFAIPDN